MKSSKKKFFFIFICWFFPDVFLKLTAKPTFYIFAFSRQFLWQLSGTNPDPPPLPKPFFLGFPRRSLWKYSGRSVLFLDGYRKNVGKTFLGTWWDSGRTSVIQRSEKLSWHFFRLFLTVLDAEKSLFCGSVKLVFSKISHIILCTSITTCYVFSNAIMI